MTITNTFKSSTNNLLTYNPPNNDLYNFSSKLNITLLSALGTNNTTCHWLFKYTDYLKIYTIKHYTYLKLCYSNIYKIFKSKPPATS